MTEFKRGDKVEWSSSQGKIAGTVVRKVTEPTKIKGYTAQASHEHPEFEVKSARTGKTAIHPPESLKKKD